MRIELDHVSCGYHGKPVVEDFSTTIATGQVTCLLGPNGVGKSTLFKTLIGLIPAIDGTIRIDGRPIGELSRREIARLVSYVPQMQHNPFSYRVLDVVVMGRTAHLKRFATPGSRDRAAAMDALTTIGAGHLSESSFNELSGGERQLVMIARALAQEPVFIMLDEPTASLDFGNQVRVLREIRRLAASGIGVLMTTHTPDHASLCGGEVILLRTGSQYLVGDPIDVLTPQNLAAAYGVEVDVTYSTDGGRRTAYCRPVMTPPRQATSEPEVAATLPNTTPKKGTTQ